MILPLPEIVLKIVFQVTSHNVTLCGCQERQQVFVSSVVSLTFERFKINRGLSQVNKVDGQFFLIEFLGSHKGCRHHNVSASVGPKKGQFHWNNEEC
jgi:hypothetical protein